MALVVSLVASALIVLGSPFMGQLQSFLRRSLSTRNYVLLFAVGLVLAIGLTMVLALARIRERRAQRFGLLCIALLCGATYMWWTATPYPEVNAVERVHFVEFGLIAFLFYRVWRDRGDPSSLILPLLAAFTVGTLDEWLQWFIPYRVGEAHDVFINLASIVCGLMFAFAIVPPATWSSRLQPASWQRLGVAAALVWLIFATFVSQVHLGHELSVAGIGRFKSHYTQEQLNVLQADRATRWRSQPPVNIERLSREDQYLDEGLWHVRRRNGADTPHEAWGENLILERFFVPVLDMPTYASPTGNRWPAEQRSNTAAHVGESGAGFVSAAEGYPIVTWPATTYWLVVAAIALSLFTVPFLLGRRRSVER